MLPDGSIADVALDLGTLARLSKDARERYGLAGAVQHGASTLPDSAFHNFPTTETAEIHLATNFQNMLFDHLPRALQQSFLDGFHSRLSSGSPVVISTSGNLPFSYLVWGFVQDSAYGQAAAASLIMLALMLPILLLYWLVARRAGIVALR